MGVVKHDPNPLQAEQVLLASGQTWLSTASRPKDGGCLGSDSVAPCIHGRQADISVTGAGTGGRMGSVPRTRVETQKGLEIHQRTTCENL